MFTGLIESTGTVRRVTPRGAGYRLQLEVRWPDGRPPLQGDSVAVNGACLTVLEPSGEGFAADLSPETVRRTLLSHLRSGQTVNLERALRFGGRLGGHLVQGHVDGVVRLLQVRNEGSFQRWRLSLPPELAPEVAAKGSVTLDGVSLTVASTGPRHFEVALIPETLRATTLGSATPGRELHLETDVLAKYVRRSLEHPGTSGKALEEIFGGGHRAAD
ncbi:MAG: riboflavin synthase [Acidobacteria bacterium]|nr:riboflavin synthase [Acidobacteriota bacterium]